MTTPLFISNILTWVFNFFGVFSVLVSNNSSNQVIQKQGFSSKEPL